VVVYPKPAVTAIATKTLLCQKETATLTAGGASSYAWSTLQTGPTITVSPASATVYTVTGYGANGCAATATIMMMRVECTGLAEQTDKREAITVYPNPANGIFNVSISSHYVYEVYSVLGEIVSKGELNIGVTELDIRNVSAGVYYLNYTDRETSGTVRLIKD
jgi:hypothetical protein